MEEAMGPGFIQDLGQRSSEHGDPSTAGDSPNPEQGEPSRMEIPPLPPSSCMEIVQGWTSVSEDGDLPTPRTKQL